MRIASETPTKVTKNGKKYLNPGIIKNQGIAKIQILLQDAWAFDHSPIRELDSHHFQNEAGQVTRPLECRMYLPTALKITMSDGRIVWAVMLENSDERNELVLEIKKTKKQAFFECKGLGIARISGALANLAQ